MKKEQVLQSMETAFRERVRKDKTLKNAYLLVHSDRMDLHLNLAEGRTGNLPADPRQPNYMASVGKLFTATIIGILCEQNRLSFSDRITEYLDPALTRGLHVHGGVDHTHEIRIRHLLKQTSGLPDQFRPLLEEVIRDPGRVYAPQDTIHWVKEHAQAHFPPGKDIRYTDTNYHLLGLIVEAITGGPFHQALKTLVFDPLGMQHAWMHQVSQPAKPVPLPMADFYLDHTRLNDCAGYAGLDYAGGGVVAPMEDLLVFMKALVNHRIVSRETLQTMRDDRTRFALGMDYGYGIWTIRTVPLLMPGRFNSWGVAGATGSFMFYQPDLDAYLIGNFNDFSHERKGLQFMMLGVMNRLAKMNTPA